MNTADLLHHVKYNRWATARALDAARAMTPEQLARPMGASFGSAHGTLAHIYQADNVWFARLQGEPTGSLSVYQPPAEFDAFQQDWMALHDRFVGWGEGLKEADWKRVVSYRDSKGNPYQSPVWQIIMHLTNHDSYHRGQVAGVMRQLGHIPAPTDLIYYYRESAATAGSSA